MRRVLVVLVAVLFLTTTSASGQSPCVSPAPLVAFGDGTWVVGADIQPGTYRARPVETCVWYRLSGFGGTSDDTITLDMSSAGPVIVTIEPTDAGFDSSGCGDWSLVA